MDYILAALTTAILLLAYWEYRMWKEQKVLQAIVALLILERQKNESDNSRLHSSKGDNDKKPLRKDRDESRDLASEKE